ncbi:hypothetical protein GCM10010431_76900 [Streptomyces kunmingensis]
MPVAVVATSATTARALGMTDLGTGLVTGLNTGTPAVGVGRWWRVGPGQPVYLAKMPVNCQVLWLTPEQVSSFG